MGGEVSAILFGSGVSHALHRYQHLSWKTRACCWRTGERNGIRFDYTVCSTPSRTSRYMFEGGGKTVLKI